MVQEQRVFLFLHDQDNRIQKLYYNVNIDTIFNKTKLQNLKNKFCKYVNYITKYKNNVIQPALLELETIQDEAYKNWQRAKRISLIHNPTPENEEKRKALVPIFRKAQEECEEIICEERRYDDVIYAIQDKLTDLKNQQKKLRHYRECAHCEKMDIVAISGCKSKHKLCSDCSHDITECPVCEEDSGLQYCAICMENKKKIIETGCENKHQTCKECLEKIIGKNNKCPFCRGYCSKEPVDPHPDSYYLMENGLFEDIRDLWQDRADDMRERG